jgi:hypothetical protein
MGGYIQFRAGARSAPTVRCWSRAFFEIAPLSLGGSDGGQPYGGVIVSAASALFGTAGYGGFAEGLNGNGTAYELIPLSSASGGLVLAYGCESITSSTRDETHEAPESRA